MARLPRLIVPGVPMHIIQRGNNREACFFSDQDYTVYLDKLKDYSKKYDVSVHAYVLMTNHVHLLVTPHTDHGISHLMQSLGRYYVRYINSVYDRTGTLWEGRFKSTLVSDERYLLTVSRYIELNPVRANMADDPTQYPWSSYQHNALGKPIELITPHEVYDRLGNTDKKRQAAYLALFEDQLGQQLITQISESTLKGCVLGDDRFKQQVEKQTSRRVEPQSRGGDRKSAAYKQAQNKQAQKNQLL